MTAALVYGAGLTLAALAAWARGGEGLRRTAVALVANWALVMTGQVITGAYAPWGWFLILDLATAFVVVWHPAGRPQALIGGVLVLQVLVHLAFGAAPGHGDNVRAYLDIIGAGGWLCIASLAWGALHGPGKRLVAAGAGRRVEGAVASHRAGVAGGP